MQKTKVTALSHNIRCFIYANNMSRSQFASKLNDRMEIYGDDVKIYTTNDIWKYDSRNSMPKDSRALTAIAELIGKSLDELLTVYFSIEELKLSTENNEKNSPQVAFSRDWSIERLNELTEDDRNFALDLLGADVCEEGGKWYTDFYIGLRYNEGKTVTATLYYGIEYEHEKTVEWSWANHGELVEELDDEATIIEIKLCNEIFDKLWSIGFTEDCFCFRANSQDVIDDERLADANGCFVANVWLSIGREDLVELFTLNLERAKEKYERLVAESKQSSKNKPQ